MTRTPIVLILAGAALVASDALILTEHEVVRRVEVSQERLHQVKQYKDGKFTIEVHEYSGPLGDGYQLFMTKKDGSITLRKSIGYGPEKESRTHDWLVVDIEVASTTP